jgi:hypothetical protein
MQLKCMAIVLATGAFAVPGYLWSDRVAFVAPQLDETGRSFAEAIEDPFCFQIDGQEVSLFEFLGLDEIEFDGEE